MGQLRELRVSELGPNAMIGTVTSKNGKEIRLTEERWSNIVDAHDYMAGNQDMVFETLESPDAIIDGGKDELIAVRQLTIEFCAKSTRNILQCPESQ